jgi:N-acylneuraminate cytidylyltransferase
MRALAFIFARGGSKGVPRKNIRSLGGKPLIAWSIEAAKACSRVARVIVSTDDHEIAEVAKRHGAEVPFMRPSELARDDSSEWLAWQHAVRAIQDTGDTFDSFLSVPATSPMRNPQDLTACLDLLGAGGCDAVVTMTPSSRNPYFNMVRRNVDETLTIAADAGRVIANRQDAPEVFDLTTVAYATTPAFILSHGDLFEGRVKGVTVPRKRCLDIDDQMDLEFAEFLIARQGSAAGRLSESRT